VSRDEGDEVQVQGLREALRDGGDVVLRNRTKERDVPVTHSLSRRQVELILEGGVVNYFKDRL